ncbi:hypothetical protein [Burkholderia gladioli]|uniref:hypothetical protein n=1 Tax=Burkholderia gladioli TaxID=28095 RepID=UPI0016414877|nr:hypothetical protein [Burkholderia gladioli]
MKSTDLHAEARQQMLRDEQAPRVVPSQAARQSTFENSTIVRVVVVLVLLVIGANLMQDAPTEAQPIAHHLTA